MFVHKANSRIDDMNWLKLEHEKIKLRGEQV